MPSLSIGGATLGEMELESGKVREDVCPQHEGFDADCEAKCLRDHPMRIGSGCFLRNHGTLLSFFGIRSFICRCELPASFCDPNLAGIDPTRRAFSIQAIQEHSMIRILPERVNCQPGRPTTCIDSFTPSDCGWARPAGVWYAATPKGQLPFAPGEAPGGQYLVATQPLQGPGKLSLETCSNLCSKGEVKMGLRVWRAPWITAELCFRDNDSMLCAPILVSNGKPVSEVLPQTDKFAVQLRFSNMTATDVVFVDDIRLEYQACDPPKLSRTEISIPRAAVPSREQREQSNPDGFDRPGPMISGSTSYNRWGESRLCVGGNCSTASSALLDPTCLGRAAQYKCQAKCRKDGQDSSSARCIRQRDYPFTKRCVCQPHRAPTAHLEAAENLVEGNGMPNERFLEQDLETNQVSDEPSPRLPPRLLTAEEVCVQEGTTGCQQYCDVHSANGTGSCTGGSRPYCRCIVCSHSSCDFERGKPCGWADLHASSTEFNNISIASKQDDENRYALTRMQPRSYSGLVKKGWTDGPITLSVDVFPSHELQVRICVDSLSRCQNQMVAGRAWNRVTARIKVTRTDKIFLLFNNASPVSKTVALDNIHVQSGLCPDRRRRRRFRFRH
ncbi:unnamed protein product, partial [Mesorhabditis spiculigera]